MTARRSVAGLPPTSGLALPEQTASSTPRLDGQKIVVTRAVPQAAPLLDALANSGATTIALPLLEIVDAEDDGAALREAVAQLGATDWLVVLSPNGARRIVELTLPVERPQLAVIAGGTGRVFADAGWSADLLPEVASSIGLLDAFADTTFAGRVLIAQAEVGRPELADGLALRGVDVEVVSAYRNVMPDLDPASVSSAQQADAVVFASPSAVDRYIANVGAAPKSAVCIGAVTGETAVAAGFDVITCGAPTIDAILAALMDRAS